MNAIYKTFWGAYIDFDKLIYVDYKLVQEGIVEVYLNFQLRENSVTKEILLFENREYFYGELLNPHNSIEDREKQCFEIFKKMYTQLINDWKKYKDDSKIRYAV